MHALAPRLAAVWLLALRCAAQVRRPASGSHSLTFEDMATSVCDLAKGTPLGNEYAARLATFRGPGFGSLNGGVPARACLLADGDFPPLGNHSFEGNGFLAFSTLHVFHDQTGKPVGPETVNFDVRATNIRVALAGIDGHSAEIELWSGPANAYNDHGELLATSVVQMSPELQSFDMLDDAGMYVDCVRRMVIRSEAKLFVLDNLFFEMTSADDSVCGPMPGGHKLTNLPPSAPGEGSTYSEVLGSGAAAHSRASAASGTAALAVAAAATALVLGAGDGSWVRRRPSAETLSP